MKNYSVLKNPHENIEPGNFYIIVTAGETPNKGNSEFAGYMYVLGATAIGRCDVYCPSLGIDRSTAEKEFASWQESL